MAEGQLIEAAAEVADHIEDVAAVTRTITRSQLGFLVAGVGIGVVVGCGVGYFVAKKRQEAKYEKLAEQSVSEMREYYQRKEEEGNEFYDQAVKNVPDKPPISEVVERLQQQAEQRPLSPPVVVREPPVGVAVTGRPWNIDEEASKRSKDRPYVIHVEEYKLNEPGYDQVVWTYFEGDDVMCDANDSVIDPVDEIVGLENLQRWGDGSRDLKVVYIRNDALTIDIMIHRAEGSFAEEVHGFIEHSGKRERRDRGFDDESSD